MMKNQRHVRFERGLKMRHSFASTSTLQCASRKKMTEREFNSAVFKFVNARELGQKSWSFPRRPGQNLPRFQSGFNPPCYSASVAPTMWAPSTETKFQFVFHDVRNYLSDCEQAIRPFERHVGHGIMSKIQADATAKFTAVWRIWGNALHGLAAFTHMWELPLPRWIVPQYFDEVAGNAMCNALMRRPAEHTLMRVSFTPSVNRVVAVKIPRGDESQFEIDVDQGFYSDTYDYYNMQYDPNLYKIGCIKGLLQHDDRDRGENLLRENGITLNMQREWMFFDVPHSHRNIPFARAGPRNVCYRCHAHFLIACNIHYGTTGQASRWSSIWQ